MKTSNARKQIYIFKFCHKKLGKLGSRVISGIAAEIIMIAGYFVFEGFLYGFVPSAVNIPANGMQGIVGLVLGVVIMKLFEKNINMPILIHQINNLLTSIQI